MIDAYGQKLVIGQTVVIPCNSKLIKGTLVGYRENTSPWFFTCLERVREGNAYISEEYVESIRYIYRVKCVDGKTRKVHKKGICAYVG